MFAILKPDQSVDLEKVSPSIYQDLDANYDNFKSHTLVSVYHFDSAWNIWERHPAGDELVVLLSGSATLTIRKEGEDDVEELSEPGAFVVVPRNTWHTAETSEPTRMLFITPGEGTENVETP
ncbi:MAG: cupin domain-containing protein [Gammaproteobacteria bacterium]